jgi:hypothetical protein
MAWSRVHRLRQTKSGQRRKRFLGEYSKGCRAFRSPPCLLGRSAALYSTRCPETVVYRGGQEARRRERPSAGQGYVGVLAQWQPLVSPFRAF